MGENEFKSERKTRQPTRTTNATNFFGGKISGETCVASFIRLMAGASYLDVF